MGKLSNIISIAIGIIGIAIGVYFHYTTKEKKEITYYLNPETYKIFNKDLIKESRKISLYKNDTVKINQNVYLTTFSIWNSGNIPIDIKDVRKDLDVNFNGIKEVLDFSVTKEIEKGVSQFSLTQLNPSSFNLKWKYFDPDDGIKLQILYTGESIISTTVETKILKTDIKKFVQIKNKSSKLFQIIVSTTIFIFLWFISFGFTKFRNTFSRIYVIRLFERKIFKISAYILFFLYLIVIPLIYWKYFSEVNSVPF